MLVLVLILILKLILRLFHKWLWKIRRNRKDSFQIEEKKGNIIDKKFYIILEYCKSDLRKLIKNYNNALINPQLIYIIIKDICLGLKEIHSKNIIHLDIKPENILIGVDNKIKIADFNISKKMNNNLTSQVGTYDYMAPEVLKKKIMIKKQIYFLWEL